MSAIDRHAVRADPPERGGPLTEESREPDSCCIKNDGQDIALLHPPWLDGDSFHNSSAMDNGSTPTPAHHEASSP
jgi:hypothetical protein